MTRENFPRMILKARSATQRTGQVKSTARIMYTSFGYVTSASHSDGRKNRGKSLVGAQLVKLFAIASRCRANQDGTAILLVGGQSRHCIQCTILMMAPIRVTRQPLGDSATTAQYRSSVTAISNRMGPGDLSSHRRAVNI
jgi:hypothetical protein